jgi:hypothetical protein
MTLVAAAALAAAAFGSPDRGSAETLQVKGQLVVLWGPTSCPAGTPSTLSCYEFPGTGSVPGLGAVAVRYVKGFNGDFDKPCVTVLPKGVIDVKGKGSLDVSVTGPTCEGLPPAQSTYGFVVTGGTGAYAGASGTIRVGSTVREGAAGAGRATDTLNGTLSVPGHEFDVTAPVLTGTSSKTARAPKGANRVRVTYSVTARDAVDGRVPVACAPRSGGFFAVGRTKVTCSASDSSGNTGRAQFTVTVRR